MRIGTSSRAILNRKRAFTLVEVVMAAALVALVYGGIINAYILTARRAEWSGYSLAAQALSIRQLETAHSARWELLDVTSGNVRDEILNNGTAFTNYSVTLLDLPLSSSITNKWMATNWFTISTNSDATAYTKTVFKTLRSDVVWAFQKNLYTNSIQTYIAPDE
jgi:type II secretory pathway pseudopilin PulG